MATYISHKRVIAIDVLHGADGDDVLIGFSTHNSGDIDWEYFRLGNGKADVLVRALTQPAWTLPEDEVDAADDVSGFAPVEESPRPGPTL